VQAGSIHISWGARQCRAPPGWQRRLLPRRLHGLLFQPLPRMPDATRLARRATWCTRRLSQDHDRTRAAAAWRGCLTSKQLQLRPDAGTAPQSSCSCGPAGVSHLKALVLVKAARCVVHRYQPVLRCGEQLAAAGARGHLRGARGMAVSGPAPCLHRCLPAIHAEGGGCRWGGCVVAWFLQAGGGFRPAHAAMQGGGPQPPRPPPASRHPCACRPSTPASAAFVGPRSGRHPAHPRPSGHPAGRS